jgi:hypothetical protein
MTNYYWGFNDKIQFGKYSGYTVLQIIALNPIYLKNLHLKGKITLHPIVVEFMKGYLPKPGSSTSSHEIKDK